MQQIFIKMFASYAGKIILKNCPVFSETHFMFMKELTRKTRNYVVETFVRTPVSL